MEMTCGMARTPARRWEGPGPGLSDGGDGVDRHDRSGRPVARSIVGEYEGSFARARDGDRGLWMFRVRVREGLLEVTLHVV